MTTTTPQVQEQETTTTTAGPCEDGCCQSAQGTPGIYESEEFPTFELCKAECESTPWCTGVEYNDVTGVCELYKTANVFGQANATCANTVCCQCGETTTTSSTPSTTTSAQEKPPVQEQEIQPTAAPTAAPTVLDECVEITPGGCCQTAAGTNGIFDVLELFTLQECKDACSAQPLICYGIEYSALTGRCELHKTPFDFNHTTPAGTDGCAEQTRCFQRTDSIGAVETVTIYFENGAIDQNNEDDWVTAVSNALTSGARRQRRAIINDASSLKYVSVGSSDSVIVGVEAGTGLKLVIENAVSGGTFVVTVDGVQYTGTLVNPGSADTANGGGAEAKSTATTVLVAAAVVGLVALAVLAAWKFGRSTKPLSATPSSLDSNSTVSPSRSNEPEEFSPFEWDNGPLPDTPVSQAGSSTAAAGTTTTAEGDSGNWLHEWEN